MQPGNKVCGNKRFNEYYRKACERVGELELKN